MTESAKSELGIVGWTDLTVEDAATIRDFYAGVTGWTPSEVSMGDYSDFSMNAPGSGQAVAGICHARGVNADLPPAWLIYITVQDVDESARICEEQGGAIVLPPRDMGEMGRYCVIRDPAGAVAGLFAHK